jgi:hypothetical protein
VPNDVLAADTVLAAGTLNAASVTLSMGTKAAALTDHAAASLRNAKSRANVE